MTRLGRLLTAALAVAAASLGVSLAGATGFPLTGRPVSAVVVTHPCGGTADATPVTGSGTTYSAVSITVPDGCAGRALALTLLNGSTVLRSGTATVAGSGATTVTVGGTYTATANLTVRAVVDGWDLPSTWSFTPPVLYGTCEVRSSATGQVIAGSTCTVTDLYVSAPWPDGSSRQTHAYVATSSNQGSGQYLHLLLDLADARGLPADWNWATSGVTSPGGQVTPTSGYRCASLPNLEATSIAGWGGGAKTYYLGIFENRAGHSGLTCS